MTRPRPTPTTIGVWVGLTAVFSLADTATVRAQDTQEANPPARILQEQHQPSTSAVWGPWPELPWDDREVERGSWVDLLNKPFDLTRRGAAGEARRYLIRRTNLNLDRLGRVIGRLVVEGRLIRTLLNEVAPGRWAEEFEWEAFALGQSQQADAYPTTADVEAARGIRYEFVPGEFDHINIPADFARLGTGMEGTLMKILAMDASAFDAIVIGLRDQIGDSAVIGSVAYSTPWSQAATISQTGGTGAAGSYQLGEMRTVPAGVTRWHGEPCAIIWFSAEGNTVIADIETDLLSVHTEGTEYFRGELALSLVDGRIVAGDIWGPLPSRIEVGIGGNPPAEQPIAAVLQQISMREQ
ncbi:MAG: hypothetical protein GTN78_04345 [Gemmatimonadales bacterium]|nr:hypothetical protein [Gemmatimonadales bacterium]NIQ99416.1 hypothetical protein [Gemmatimonadales bacterium]NIS64084.1 hypothetical protein [Gemmatimonadales bacterium]